MPEHMNYFRCWFDLFQIQYPPAAAAHGGTRPQLVIPAIRAPPIPTVEVNVPCDLGIADYRGLTLAVLDDFLRRKLETYNIQNRTNVTIIPLNRIKVTIIKSDPTEGLAGFFKYNRL